jgi:hypothetical protein
MSWTERFAVAVVVLPGPALPLDLAQQILERQVVLESGYSCAPAVPVMAVPALVVPALAVPALAVPALAVPVLAGQSFAVLAYAGRALVVLTLAARSWTGLALAAPALIVPCLGLAKTTLTAQHREQQLAGLFSGAFEVHSSASLAAAVAPGLVHFAQVLVQLTVVALAAAPHTVHSQDRLDGRPFDLASVVA